MQNWKVRVTTVRINDEFTVTCNSCTTGLKNLTYCRTSFAEFLWFVKSFLHPPIHPQYPNRCNHWTPEGHCGCLVDFLSTTPNSIIFKITTGTCVLKTNFYTHKKKSHLPALILKFLTTTPNLTWNFETWHQILKPIRILVKTLIIYIGTCIHYLCTIKV